MSRRSVLYRLPVIAAGLAALAVPASALPASAAPLGDPPTSATPPTAMAPRDAPGFIIPESSVRRPADAGLRAHTNTVMLKLGKGVTPANEPSPGEFHETPASLACLYNVVAHTTGCNPDTVTLNASGGSKAVAIVDAYDDPYMLSDLTIFAAQFHLPAPSSSKVQVVYASGSEPPFDSGWYGEEALDVEMVYAMAPKAKIYLVEAASNSNADLFRAEQVAAKLVAAAGGGEVTNSWGSDEFAGETSSAYAAPFTGTSTVFFASSGDGITPEYPAVLPTVVAVGGTGIRRNPATGALAGFTTWVDAYAGLGAGSGPSLYVSRPSYQSHVAGVVGTKRGVPDVALDAAPSTGVWVYDGEWDVYGGTSVASPLMAGITNAAGHFAVSTTAELTAI